MGRAIKRALALLIALLLALPTCALADDAAEDFAAYEDAAFAEDTDALFESVDAEVGETEWDLPGAEDGDWADAESDEPTDGDIAPDDAATVEPEPEDVVSEDMDTGDATLDPEPAPEGTDESDPDDTEESTLDDADKTVPDGTDESTPEVASDPEAEGDASNEATYLDEDAADEADPGVADESAPDAEDEFAPETAEDADADAEVEADEADFVEPVDEIVPEAVEFNQSETVNGVVVSVSALPGVFPEGAALSVKRVPTYKQRQAGQAIDEVRDEDQNVATSYTFDIKVIDPETREEYQPGEGNAVAVSFTLSEAADANLETNVYHVTGEAGSLTAEKLEADVDAGAETVTAESDGFSLYTVEFTYNSIEYVMQGGTSVALSDVLSFVGLSGEAEAVAVSDERLFSASDATGEWILTSHQAFTTPEWMKVTINGKVFEIAVTDKTGNVAYLDDQGEQQTKDDVTVLTTGDTATLTGWYVVRGTVTIAKRIEVSVEAHLILADGAALIAPYGIHVGPGNALTIYGQAQNTGNLYINYDTATHTFNSASYDGQENAGIGGNANESAGSITINGGNLKVKGFSSGAGIGGGRYGSDGGNIAINSGKVLAVSGGYAAGIGGGEGESNTSQGSGGNITINGGTVEATGAGGGAGIGPGHIASGQNSGGTIVINGGSVTATGGNSGKAIGASNSSTAADLSLYSNAKVTAGVSSGDAEAKLTSDRLNACSGNIYARIEPCTEHEYIYQTDETNHRPVCKFCATEGTEESHNLQNGTCTVCGYKPFYNIGIPTLPHGSVAASIAGTAVTQARAGDKVTLTVSVAENYILDSLSVVTNDPNIEGVYFYNDKEGQQTFEFTMPGHAVEVKPAIATKWKWLQNNISRIENASDENTLVLPFDVTAMAEDGEPLTIKTEKSFTLDLNNHTVDRGLSAARTDGSVFVVTGNITNSRVTIKNGTVNGGFNQSYGGGINANYGGELTLQGVALQGNRAAAGGGIYISRANVVIDGCTIDGNVLEKVNNITARGGGGGIYYEAMLGASGRFTGSMAYVDILNNKAGYGAGIVIQSNNNADVALELDYASVTDNIATGNGGGIWMEGPKTRLKLVQTNVNKNMASCGGGACVANGAELDIDSWANYINENHARQGGGLYINGASVVSRYSLNNNTADADGGGAYVTANTDYDTLLSMNDSNSMCRGNKAGGNGGGIYVKGLDNSTHTTRVSITSENAQRGIRENRADGYGGGVYITGPRRGYRRDDPMDPEHGGRRGDHHQRPEAAGQRRNQRLLKRQDGRTIRWAGTTRRTRPSSACPWRRASRTIPAPTTARRTTSR